MTASDFKTPEWDSLGEAEIDRYLRRGRKLRAEQAGALFAALKAALAELFRARPAKRGDGTCATPARATL